jgi:hypothetical protein
VVGSCEYSDEPSGSGATDLVSFNGVQSEIDYLLRSVLYQVLIAIELRISFLMSLYVLP